MPLAKLLAQQALTILGLNSGTSADGLDLAVVRVRGFGKSQSIQFIAGATRPYPKAIRAEVLRLTDNPTTTLEHLILVDNLLGEFFGKSAAAYIKRLNNKKVAIDAIASHGQTVYHLPKKQKLAAFTLNGTLQLGSLERIAAHTGKDTVGDFRQADVALGNEGAPITVAAMHKLFGDSHESRLILNIGGMANYFYFPKGQRTDRILAADTGPGNSLSDLLCQHLYHQPFDRNGRYAKAGTYSRRLLTWVLGMPFFRGQTVSTGRELFGARLADRIAGEGKRLGLSSEGIMSTAVEITAQAICLKLQPIITRDSSINKIYLTGGGVHNAFIRERLAAAMPSVKIGSVADLGFNPSLVEATAYAVMGASCLRSEPMRTRFAGKTQTVRPILGKVVQPPIR